MEVSHPAWSSETARELVVTNTCLWVDAENHMGVDVGEVHVQLPRQGTEGEQRVFETLAGGTKELGSPLSFQNPHHQVPQGSRCRHESGVA